MNTTRTGMVLATREYSGCVESYTNILGLSIMFSVENSRSMLTRRDMGGGVYPMIESRGPCALEGEPSAGFRCGCGST